jgi:hypothetical protein
MKPIAWITFLLMIAGCAAAKTDSTKQSRDRPQVTIPNGSSPPAMEGANGNEIEVRRVFNHGNGALWVSLPADGTLKCDVERDGTLRIKFPWWRGVPGRLTVEGRRLDAPAAPMRSDIGTVAQIGELGVNPGILFFASEGEWEITGRVGDKSLTFVVRVVKASSA